MDTELRFCVYQHLNKTNGKCYIGITSQTPPEKRWGPRGSLYKNQHFWKAISKYGWNGFEHNILYEGLSNLEALDIEASLIAKYKKKGLSYNISDGYDLGTDVSKKINVYTIDGVFLGSYCSIHRASLVYNIAESSISACASGYHNVKQIKGYIFLFEGNSIDERLSFIHNYHRKPSRISTTGRKNISEYMKNRIISVSTRDKMRKNSYNNFKDSREKSKKKVNMLNDENVVLKTFNSIAEAANYLGNIKLTSKISSCCYGKRIHCRNYKWKYA